MKLRLIQVWDVATLSRLKYWVTLTWFLLFVAPRLIAGAVMAWVYLNEVEYSGDVHDLIEWSERSWPAMVPNSFVWWCYLWSETAVWHYVGMVLAGVAVVMLLGALLRGK